MEVVTFKEYVKAYCGGFYSLSLKTMSLRDSATRLRMAEGSEVWQLGTA